MNNCTATLNVDVNLIESDKIIRRLHEINENLASIRGGLNEFQVRILGDSPSKVCSSPEAPTPTPSQNFLAQTHYVLDDSFTAIAAIRETISKLQRF